MLRYIHQPLLHTLTFFGIFALLVLWRAEQPAQVMPEPSHDRVVITAPVLAPLYAGDRFLAANLETIRLSATGVDSGSADTFYLLRAHKVVADLNPCHENNYYLANALLTWGGAVEEGGDIIQRASDCRFWDKWPPFIYGFNQFFFSHNIEKAQFWLEIAAKRADPRNAAAFRTLAVMIEVEQVEDEKIALEILREARDQASDTRLVEKLNQRIARLKGLATLRDAQRQFEKQTGEKLSEPSQLIESGMLTQFPSDPMRMGYEFTDGQFRLKTAKIAGM